MLGEGHSLHDIVLLGQLAGGGDMLLASMYMHDRKYG